MPIEEEEIPRYLRFLRSAVVGAALSSAPLTSAGCRDDDDDCQGNTCGDLSPDANEIVDAGDIVDAGGVVDGPLPPPDLPKRA